MLPIQMVDLKRQYAKIKHEVDQAVLDVMESTAFINGKPAPTDKYRFGFMWYVHIENGKVTKVTLL